MISEIHDMTLVYKGDTVPFDGAIVPMQTLRKYDEFRLNYQLLKDEYIVKGGDTTASWKDWKQDAARATLIVCGGLLMGSLVAQDPSARNVILIVGGVGVLGSAIVLTF